MWEVHDIAAKRAGRRVSRSNRQFQRGFATCNPAALFWSIFPIDIFPYGNVLFVLLARAATTTDAFNAVAEPRRREILDYLARQERSVGDIVTRLGLGQPSVSKHLRVLRDVELVSVRRDGRRMLYRTNANAIRPLHEWTKTFERFWQHQLNRIKALAESKTTAPDTD